MIWPCLSSGATSLLSCVSRSKLGVLQNTRTRNATRRQAVATMDHADIRGLVTDLTSVRRGAAYTLASEIIRAMLTYPARGFPSSGPRIAFLLRCLGYEVRVRALAILLVEM